MSGSDIAGFIVLGGFALTCIAVVVLYIRWDRRTRPNYDGFARGLKRIRDSERRMDPHAPSVLRLLPTKEDRIL